MRASDLAQGEQHDRVVDSIDRLRHDRVVGPRVPFDFKGRPSNSDLVTPEEAGMELRFEVYGRIERSVADVFDAVYNPDKLSGYFTTGGASAPLDEGTTVTWDFADFPGAFPVTVRTMARDRLIVLDWTSGEDEATTQVRIEFEPLDEGSTMVRISEGTWRPTQSNLDRSYGNFMGWTQMIACMKVVLTRFGEHHRVHESGSRPRSTWSTASTCATATSSKRSR